MNHIDTIRRDLRALAWAGIALALMPAAAMAGEAAYKVVHSFVGAAVDGRFPTGGLTLGSDGKLHGVTGDAAPPNEGTVFRMTPGGHLTVLHRFDDGVNGEAPQGQIQARDGDYYGVTNGGGADYGGTVYRMNPHGDLAVLHSFVADYQDGFHPAGKLVQGTDGDFYGTTYQGGTYGQYGCIYRINRHGKVRVLHSFDGTDGDQPNGGLIQASDGSFYGTTEGGGGGFAGTVFKITAAGAFDLLHAFAADGHEGRLPSSGLVEGPDGQFYGVNQYGGVDNRGTVYRMDRNGVVTVLHEFKADGISGSYARGDLLLARDGHFYGVTWFGGRHDRGTVYRVTTDGTVTQLHAFNPGVKDGVRPTAGLVEVGDGEFYGTTDGGGDNDFGTVYRIRLK